MESKTRRIQLTGGSTYIVSLPINWISSNSLGKGSEVEVEEDHGRILITPSSYKKEDVVRTINVGEEIDSKKFQRILISMYIANFDTLVVKSKGHMFEKIRETV